MSKRIGTYERGLLRAAHRSKRQVKEQNAAGQQKVCSNINCPSLGALLSFAEFYNASNRSDGKDTYCIVCRKKANGASYVKNPDRGDAWRRRASVNAKAQLEKRKLAGEYEFKQTLCSKHPWMLKADCYIGECANRKRDLRCVPRSSVVRKKISEAMQGSCNNKKGVNMRPGCTRTKSKPMSGEARENIRKAALLRWKMGRSKRFGKGAKGKK